MTDTEGETRQQYPPIGSLGAIGDGRSLALLGREGAIEWFCPVRFDEPPLIWPFLDRQHGGRLRIGASEVDSSSMRYLPETAVLEFVWTTRTGTARAQVCMEWPSPADQQRLLWTVTGVEGTTEIDLDFLPRPDFGREIADIQCGPEAARLRAGGFSSTLQSAYALILEGDRVQARGRLKAGETATFCVSFAIRPDLPATPIALSSVAQRIEETKSAWRSWAAAINWTRPYRDAVVRSAITLKLLIYEPRGSVVAAGTTSLPETIGGVRNWDYRFTWFRDAGLVLDALYSLGCEHEAHRWAEWMQETVMHHRVPLQVLYTVDGKAPPAEQIVPHVEGYRQSIPVRTGNAADGQFQLDIYGELLECVFICDTMDDDVMRRHWDHLRQAADFIAAHWREPDRGIWEVRSASQHFVHSKVVAWAGLRRALWLQSRHTLDCDSDRWQEEAAAIRRDVLQNDVSEDGSRFVRAYDDPGLDASLLLLARYGFVDGRDQRFQNTVDAIQAELGTGHWALGTRVTGCSGVSPMRATTASQAMKAPLSLAC
jgi:GH15 family glucan-1,4-alpha-glucosidase